MSSGNGKGKTTKEMRFIVGGSKAYPTKYKKGRMKDQNGEVEIIRPAHSCTAEIIAELERVLERYAEWYNKVSKEHGVKQEVPHTAFHQIIEEQIKELRGRS